MTPTMNNSRMFISRAASFVLLLLAAGGASSVHAQWVANGRDATFTMQLPQAKKADTHAVFLVTYESRWSCRPAVSVILMTGRSLGTPQRQSTERLRKDQLSIEVDGRRFYGETKVTMYTNAMELAMFAPDGLIDALRSDPRTVIARLGEGLGGFDFSDGKGFARANAAAQAACR